MQNNGVGDVPLPPEKARTYKQKYLGASKNVRDAETERSVYVMGKRAPPWAYAIFFTIPDI